MMTIVKNNWKIFLLSNLISLSNYKSLKDPSKWQEEADKLFYRCLRSLAFLAGYGFLGKLTFCYLKDFTDKEIYLLKFYTLISSFSIFLENNDRWKEMSLYVTPKFIESILLYLRKRRKLVWFPYFEVNFFY